MIRNSLVFCENCGEARRYDGVITAQGFIGRLQALAPTGEELIAFQAAVTNAATPQEAALAVTTAVPRLAELVSDWGGWPLDTWLKFLPSLLALLLALFAVAGQPSAVTVTAAAAAAIVSAGALRDADKKERRAARKRERDARRDGRRAKK